MSSLRQMPCTRPLPNSIGANAAISACATGYQWQLALHLFHSLPSRDVAPDSISFNSAITACEKVGMWSSALWLLAVMPESRIIPDQISFSSAISAKFLQLGIFHSLCCLVLFGTDLLRVF